jgi:5-oxoprolinase (ATP-hydrolysing)
MPPTATRLAEEGVVIPPTHVIRGGEPRWDAVRALLSGGPHPTRNLEDNLADLVAAAAANHAGSTSLRALAAAAGSGTVLRYMRALRELAARRIREALTARPDGTFEAEQRLDDGTPIRVAITIAGDRATIDFEGTAGVHPGNLNATPAIVASATMFVMRLLIDDPIPLNEGLLDPIDLRVPPGLLDPPFDADPERSPAVVGGNVETSQRIVDTLTLALRLAACSQGTMNNVLFGNDRLGYYETICGGMGAGRSFDGASAVHSNMTNTRITDPEVLEHRYPVRVERFAIRRGSGGAGARNGGDGVIRVLRFLAPMRLSVLTQHRVERPFGMDGGAPGARGAQHVQRADGRRIDLGPIDGADLEPGDRFVIETPGGGGWGERDPSVEPPKRTAPVR